jgi:hypothetical protein
MDTRMKTRPDALWCGFMGHVLVCVGGGSGGGGMSGGGCAGKYNNAQLHCSACRECRMGLCFLSATW